MVREQIAGRGIDDARVLSALRAVPRERFVPRALEASAYEDVPLPIELGQTISQPYIVAEMLAAARLASGDRVLEIGTGSGYAAAVASRIVGEVYTVERHAPLARTAEARLRALGYTNVHVRVGDGTLGLLEHAPYDAIIVSAGGPSVPRTLIDQLAPNGRIIIPVGDRERVQRLLRLTGDGHGGFSQEDLGAVRFVPLVGARGFAEGGVRRDETDRAPQLAAAMEPFDDIETASLDAMLARIGDARIVLLGEATHGTSEFHRMRARITRELVLRRGFDTIAIEADWPDAAVVDRYVRRLPVRAHTAAAFERFPTWMWRNEETLAFIEWLRAHNDEARTTTRRVSLHGLDMYSLHTSIDEVVRYLDRVDPDAAQVARRRYACLDPWSEDPVAYGHETAHGGLAHCEDEVVTTLRALLDARLRYANEDDEALLDAVQNARLVANAERYYRLMYAGAVASWNLRDQHMFDTLEVLRTHRGPEAKIVVWAHNSHLGDARATEMHARGEHNLGSLVRAARPGEVHAVGFGTHHGTVAAASTWNGPMRVQHVRPAIEGSYEALFHRAGVARGILPLGHLEPRALHDALARPRLERAIGVVYRPETERMSHYFEAVLPKQFDEYVWFDETHALTPLPATSERGAPDTYPFGL